MFLVCTLAYGSMFTWPAKFFEKKANAGLWFFVGTSAVSSFTNIKSALFDGSNDYIDWGNILDFDGSTAFTISTWLKASGSSDQLVTKASGSYASEIGFDFYINSGNTANLRMRDSGGGVLWAQGSTTVNTGSWTHLAVTYDGSKDYTGVKFYKDNVYTAASNASNTFTGSMSNAGSLKFADGPIASYGYAGTMGDTVIIPAELDSDDIAELYNSGTEVDMTTTSFWNTYKADSKTLWVTWEVADFDVGDQPGITDQSDNGFTGTAQGAMETASDWVADAPP